LREKYGGPLGRAFGRMKDAPAINSDDAHPSQRLLTIAYYFPTPSIVKLQSFEE